MSIFLYLRACVCCRPRSCPTSPSPTCPSSPTSLRRRCSPPSSTTRSCPSGRTKSHCSASLTLASTRPASTTSALPAFDLPATRGVPSWRSPVSSAGRGVNAQKCCLLHRTTWLKWEPKRLKRLIHSRRAVVLIGSRIETHGSACCARVSVLQSIPRVH